MLNVFAFVLLFTAAAGFAFMAGDCLGYRRRK